MTTLVVGGQAIPLTQHQRSITVTLPVYTAVVVALISAWTIVASLVFSRPTVQDLALGAPLAVGGLAVVGLTGHQVSVEHAARSSKDATSEPEGTLAATA